MRSKCRRHAIANINEGSQPNKILDSMQTCSSSLPVFPSLRALLCYPLCVHVHFTSSTFSSHLFLPALWYGVIFRSYPLSYPLPSFLLTSRMRSGMESHCMDMHSIIGS